MLLFRIVIVLAALGLWVYATYDVVRTPSDKVRILPKLVWLVLVLATSLLGSVAWLLVGRPASARSIFTPGPPSGRVKPPDDSPEYLARLDEEIQRRRRTEEIRRSQNLDPELRRTLDEEIQRLEEELRRDAEDED